MNAIVSELEKYIQNTLGEVPEITAWKDAEKLALFLRDRYGFFEGKVLDKPCLFMADNGDHEDPPSTIRKHLDQVHTKWNGPVIYVRERIAAYNRKRLVEQKIPFIVPGNQMYLPMLAIDLREHFRKPRPDARGLRPSSQAVLIYALLHDAEDMGPTALAAKLGYSAMAMTQALNELEAAELVVTTSTGRGSVRNLRFNSPRQAVWEKAEPLLKTPVKNRHTVLLQPERNHPGPQSGLSALSRYSMLAAPRTVTIAVSREDWKLLRERDAVNNAMGDEPGALALEVWGYAPTLFAVEGWVDRLSLYLSLRETDDERVQAALEQMMKEVAW